jgi:glycosyltransferase involved in cell wall biosynthesis
MTQNDQIAIFVFSYNRGRFLENCLKSILELMPDCPRYIVDDDSQDSFTIDVMNRFSDKFVILTPDTDHAAEAKTGGLYENMNHAVAIAKQARYNRALFIQDDMQIVRPFTERDYYFIEKYFASNEDCIQLVTTFIRTLSSRRFLKETALCQSQMAYFREKMFQRGKSNFSAIGLFDVNRVVEKFGSFVRGEENNSKKAMSLGIKCGYSVYPFMNWLPYPTSFRGRTRASTHRIMEFVGGSGFHPITTMDEDLMRRFFDRDPRQLPIMENWLSAPTAPRKKIWSTGGGEYNMMARFRFLAKMASVLRAMRNAKA